MKNILKNIYLFLLEIYEIMDKIYSPIEVF